MTTKELRQALKFAATTAREAGGILKKGFAGKFKVSFKSKIDPVTEFDLKSDRHIVARLTKKFPKHSIMTEEGSDSDKNSDYTWIIDPLDGTVNFSHGFPMYAVSIALKHKEKCILGVVFDPERAELFSAGYGLGAYLNSNKIAVSQESNLERSLVSTGFGYNVRTARLNNLGFFARMTKSAQAVRRAGSAAIDLSWVACGRFEGLWEFYLHPWDSAAGIVIVEEAGGKISRIDGKKYSIFDNNIVATNGRIHKQMLNVLTKNKKK